MAVVPQPILKSCLDEMALDKDNANQFADSDDDEEEDEKPKTKKGKAGKDEPIGIEANSYKGSLCFKPGKGSNSSIYYVKYVVAKNGNGLDRDEKNQLAAKLAEAQAQVVSLKATLQQTRTETQTLLAQPTNEQAVLRIDEEGTALQQLDTKVQDARQLKVDEKSLQKIKRRVNNMVSHWRKRRRLCMDFLYSMEEHTDGTISAKKCLAGDGQIELDSDEVIAKRAVEYGRKKRTTNRRPTKRAKTTSHVPPGMEPNEAFVAVLLDANKGSVKRVYLDGDE